MTYFGSLNEFTHKNVNIKGRIPGNYSGGINNKIKISFIKNAVDYRSAVGFAILDADNRFLWYSSAKITKESYILNLTDFDYLAVGDAPARFKLYLVFENDDEFVFNRIYSRKIRDEYIRTQDKSILFYDTVASSEIEGNFVDLVVNITTSGYFGFILMNRSDRLNFVLTTTVESFDILGDEYVFSVKMEKPDSCRNFGLYLQSRISQDKYYDLAPASVDDRGKYFVLSYRFKNNFLNLELPDILTLSSYYEINNFKYKVGVKTANNKIWEKIKNLADVNNSRVSLDLLALTVRLSQEKLQFSTVLPQDGVKITKENTAKRILFSSDFLPGRVMFGEQRVYNDEVYKIKIFADVSKIGDMSAFVYNKKRQEKIIVDVTEFNSSSGEMTIDLSAMGETMSDFTARAYKLCVAFSYKGYMYCCTLRSPDFLIGGHSEENQTDVNEHLLKEVMSFNVSDSVIILQPMYDAKGYFHIYLTDRMLSKQSKVNVNFERVYFKKNFLITEVDVSGNTEYFTGFALSYRYKKSEDKRIYFQRGELVAKGNRTILRSKFDLSMLELTKTVWDLYVVFIDDEIPYFTPVNISNKQREKYFYSSRNFLFKNYYEFYTPNGTDVFFPYFTTANTLAFSVREKNIYDSKSFRHKEFFALFIYKLFKSHYRRKRIILTYEKYGKFAQDNSYHFFIHCMRHKVQKRLNANIYYVIDKNSEDYKKLKKYDSNVINFLSLKHMIYIIAAGLLVSSNTANHCYIGKQSNSCITGFLKQKKLFFLQNCVTSLKKVDYVLGKDKAQNIKRVVATSKREQDIIVNNLGYKPQEVCVTGLARWDTLKDRSKNSNEILLLPTWRVWLDETEENNFLESDYYKNYMALLNNKRLHKFLEQQDLVLKFYLNSKLENYIDNFSYESDRIVKVTYEEEPSDELIMKCKLMITDYSSICWDVLYMGKPVLFYQFDYNKYNRLSGSYINMEKELLGDRSLTPEALLYDLEKSAKNGFMLPYEYRLMRENSFSYIDDKNCARIVQEIRKIKW